MIQAIKGFRPPDSSTPYNPSRKVTVPGNSSIDVELEGRGGKTFGITRILPYGSDMSDITAKLTLNEEFTILKPVSLAVIRQHFKRMELLAPYVIQEENNLIVTLSKSTAGDQDVNIELLGYDEPALAKLKRLYATKGIPMPKPNLLYANEEIAANATKQIVEIKTKSVDVDLVRYSIANESDDNITVSLKRWNDNVKNEVFIQQINDEFEDGYSKVPFRIGKNIPLSLAVSNSDSNAHELSFLGEAYTTE